MPIVSHSFGNIPYMGVVVTPVAMLTAYAVVCCGIFVLLLPHSAALPFGWVMEHAARVQNGFVEWVAQWVKKAYVPKETDVKKNAFYNVHPDFEIIYTD